MILKKQFLANEKRLQEIYIVELTSKLCKNQVGDCVASGKTECSELSDLELRRPFTLY